MPTTQDGQVATTQRDTWLRAVVLLVLLLAGLGVALTTDLPSVEDVRAWVGDAGGAGWTAMALGLALVLLAPVPRSAVTVLVGVVAGFWPGLAISLSGGLLGALGAFGLSRGLGRAAAVRLAGPGLARIDRHMGERGFLPVLAGRLLPIVPFVALSYGAGLTGVRWAPYVLATALGLVPSTAVQVGIGASAGAVVDSATAATVLPLAALAVVAVVWGVVGLRRRRARPPAPVG